MFPRTKVGGKSGIRQSGKGDAVQSSNKGCSSSAKVRGIVGDKFLCTTRLLSSLWLAPFPRGPVFTLISQMLGEDGWMNILLPVLDRFLAEDVRLIVLGDVRDKDGSTLRFIARRHVSKFSYLQEYDDSWANRVLRGSHALLAPTPITEEEPGSIFLTRALRYGAIPVASARRSLCRLVQEYDETSNTGYGFIFYDATPNAFLDSVRQSIEIFQKKKLWESMVARAILTSCSQKFP
ncbi:Glycogen synthase [Candidatus Xiphinematobacter sp. Idaho Grape]|uniref:hypothetical protein n=1 Tax=Candidatus Xiphinematobacter sp. Idaho Grape TaxID=1704307 RepID=UPI000706B190|nr:hypothetical protein [Candidatus Xiphinematobacter sp. Idaho Grape]ALJ56845.1 Glycogen synthase [Candidatus Xiphinematobacter sp. Idaho Grape]